MKKILLVTTGLVLMSVVHAASSSSQENSQTHALEKKYQHLSIKGLKKEIKRTKRTPFYGNNGDNNIYSRLKEAKNIAKAQKIKTTDKHQTSSAFKAFCEAKALQLLEEKSENSLLAALELYRYAAYGNPEKEKSAYYFSENLYVLWYLFDIKGVRNTDVFSRSFVGKSASITCPKNEILDCFLKNNWFFENLANNDDALKYLNNKISDLTNDGGITGTAFAPNSPYSKLVVARITENRSFLERSAAAGLPDAVDLLRATNQNDVKINKKTLADICEISWMIGGSIEQKMQDSSLELPSSTYNQRLCDMILAMQRDISFILSYKQIHDDLYKKVKPALNANKYIESPKSNPIALIYSFIEKVEKYKTTNQKILEILLPPQYLKNIRNTDLLSAPSCLSLLNLAYSPTTKIDMIDCVADLSAIDFSTIKPILRSTIYKDQLIFNFQTFLPRHQMALSFFDMSDQEKSELKYFLNTIKFRITEEKIAAEQALNAILGKNILFNKKGDILPQMTTFGQMLSSQDCKKFLDYDRLSNPEMYRKSNLVVQFLLRFHSMLRLERDLFQLAETFYVLLNDPAQLKSLIDIDQAVKSAPKSVLFCSSSSSLPESQVQQSSIVPPYYLRHMENEATAIAPFTQSTEDKACVLYSALFAGLQVPPLREILLRNFTLEDDMLVYAFGSKEIRIPTIEAIHDKNLHVSNNPYVNGFGRALKHYQFEMGNVAEIIDDSMQIINPETETDYLFGQKIIHCGTLNNAHYIFSDRTAHIFCLNQYGEITNIIDMSNKIISIALSETTHSGSLYYDQVRGKFVLFDNQSRTVQDLNQSEILMNLREQNAAFQIIGLV